MKHIIIIGFMGTGKSSVGKKLARELGRPWLDTDHELEKRQQQSIAHYFQQYGEASFRERESRVLAELLARSPLVMTTGGGIVLKTDNRRLMEKNGWVVALSAKPNTIIRRLKQEAIAARPLLADNPVQKVHELYQKRRNLYDFADFHVETDRLTVTEVVQKIVQHWQQKQE